MSCNNEDEIKKSGMLNNNNKSISINFRTSITEINELMKAELTSVAACRLAWFNLRFVFVVCWFEFKLKFNST